MKHCLDLEKFEQAVAAHPDKRTRDFIVSTIRDEADIGTNTDRGGSKGWACKNSGTLNQEYGRLIREECPEGCEGGVQAGYFQKTTVR